MKVAYTKKGYQLKNPTLPILFISGGEDVMRLDDIKWFNSIEFLREMGYENATGKLYEGMRHEIHNEIGKEIVYKNVLTYLSR